MSALLAEYAARVRAAPADPALVVGPEVLTYQQLDQASARLAARLAGAGARPGTVVGIHLPQCADSFVAMLACFRAGYTWAVVEPAQPAGRLRALLADTDCAVILHSEVGAAALRELLASYPSEASPATALLPIDEPLRVGDAPAATTVPEGLPAYVIYTSGSTGRPKGVLVSRAQLAASVLSREWLYGAEPPVFADLMRFSFDGSLAAAFWAIAKGGTLVALAEHQLREPAAAAALAARHRATHLISVPSYYRLLLPHSDALPAALHTAIVGGEPCTAELVTAHQAALPEVSLINEYGPTEAVVSCTAHRVRNVPATTAPIGRPHPGATVRVLDEKLRPLPAGSVGELYVGGAFPALGYARQPARTAERFVADPYADRPGSRLYRTGDLASWDADGELVFRGRADEQVKVRGHRIELGEIARVLERHRAVVRAEVVAVPGSTDPELVAVLDSGEEPGPSAAELREHCRRFLLEPAVPSRFEFEQQLPVSETGKVDRAALTRRLTSMDAIAAEPTGGPASAGWDERQQALWSMWCAVLGHSEAGLQDSFFELGGTSLKLIDLHNRIERQWPGVLRVGELFDLTTVEAQARAVGERTGAPETTMRPEVASYEL